MSYASYEFYTDTYGGSLIPWGEFNSLAIQSSAYIDYYTNGKAANYDDANGKLAIACCKLADDMYMSGTNAASTQISAGVSSETVGAYSVSYMDISMYKASLRSVWNDLLGIYLSGTGLTYRGVPVVYTSLRNHI